jgi:Ca2+-transporting ATPase
MLIWKKSPLLSMQLLWINLVTDSLPAIALGMETVESDVMDKKTKPKSEGIFANGMGIQVGLQGAMFALLTLIGFRIGCNNGDVTTGRTMAFIILSSSQVIHSFNMRSNHSLFKKGVFTNKYLNGAAGISIALIALVVFISPISKAFALTQLPGWMYLLALGLALIPVLVLELSKAFGIIKHVQ